MPLTSVPSDFNIFALPQLYNKLKSPRSLPSAEKFLFLFLTIFIKISRMLMLSFYLYTLERKST
jgi:hypothetical protein